MGMVTHNDETDCILCGGCIDICPVNCIELIRTSSATIPATVSTQVWQEGSNSEDVLLLIKKDAACIRCGLCVKRCPTGTFIMEEESG